MLLDIKDIIQYCHEDGNVNICLYMSKLHDFYFCVIFIKK
jgi:hypothetical protein